jgi:hypothetical protein
MQNVHTADNPTSTCCERPELAKTGDPAPSRRSQVSIEKGLQDDPHRKQVEAEGWTMYPMQGNHVTKRDGRLKCRAATV